MGPEVLIRWRSSRARRYGRGAGRTGRWRSERCGRRTCRDRLDRRLRPPGSTPSWRGTGTSRHCSSCGLWCVVFVPGCTSLSCAVWRTRSQPGRRSLRSSAGSSPSRSPQSERRRIIGCAYTARHVSTSVGSSRSKLRTCGGCRREGVHLLHRPEALRARRLLDARIVQPHAEAQPRVRLTDLVVDRVRRHRRHRAQDPGGTLGRAALLEQPRLNSERMAPTHVAHEPVTQLDVASSCRRLWGRCDASQRCGNWGSRLLRASAAPYTRTARGRRRASWV